MVEKRSCVMQVLAIRMVLASLRAVTLGKMVGSASEGADKGEQAGERENVKRRRTAVEDFCYWAKRLIAMSL